MMARRIALEDTVRIIAVWLHILGVALFVGPQFFLAMAWVPASRKIVDLPTRVAAMRVVTRRFGYIGGMGLMLILVAGLYLITSWRDYYGVPDDAEFTSIRYGLVFIIKMNVLLVMLAVVGLHTFVVGPRQLAKLEAQARGEKVTDEELRAIRMRSMALSITGLVLALVLMVMGVMMNTANWSLQDA